MPIEEKKQIPGRMGKRAVSASPSEPSVSRYRIITFKASDNNPRLGPGSHLESYFSELRLRELQPCGSGDRWLQASFDTDPRPCILEVEPQAGDGLGSFTLKFASPYKQIDFGTLSSVSPGAPFHGKKTVTLSGSGENFKLWEFLCYEAKLSEAAIDELVARAPSAATKAHPSPRVEEEGDDDTALEPSSAGLSVVGGALTLGRSRAFPAPAIEKPAVPEPEAAVVPPGRAMEAKEEERTDKAVVTDSPEGDGIVQGPELGNVITPVESSVDSAPAVAAGIHTDKTNGKETVMKKKKENQQLIAAVVEAVCTKLGIAGGSLTIEAQGLIALILKPKEGLNQPSLAVCKAIGVADPTMYRYKRDAEAAAAKDKKLGDWVKALIAEMKAKFLGDGEVSSPASSAKSAPAAKAGKSVLAARPASSSNGAVAGNVLEVGVCILHNLLPGTTSLELAEALGLSEEQILIIVGRAGFAPPTDSNSDLAKLSKAARTLGLVQDD